MICTCVCVCVCVWKAHYITHFAPCAAPLRLSLNELSTPVSVWEKRDVCVCVCVCVWDRSLVWCAQETNTQHSIFMAFHRYHLWVHGWIVHVSVCNCAETHSRLEEYWYLHLFWYETTDVINLSIAFMWCQITEGECWWQCVDLVILPVSAGVRPRFNFIRDNLLDASFNILKSHHIIRGAKSWVMCLIVNGLIDCLRQTRSACSVSLPQAVCPQA